MTESRVKSKCPPVLSPVRNWEEEAGVCGAGTLSNGLGGGVFWRFGSYGRLKASACTSLVFGVGNCIGEASQASGLQCPPARCQLSAGSETHDGAASSSNLHLPLSGALPVSGPPLGVPGMGGGIPHSLPLIPQLKLLEAKLGLFRPAPAVHSCSGAKPLLSSLLGGAGVQPWL